MNLNEKIRHILTMKDLSPSYFADEIGIQRSSISHILAGRNKPSLDIVQKIIRRFPDLGINWIFDDQDLPDVPETESIPDFPESNRSIPVERELRTEKTVETTPVQPNLPEPQKIAEKKQLERVLMFYTDGTFEEYKPNRS